MAKVLMLTLFEPGSYHERSLANKHGLRTAFRNLGHDVVEKDYLTYKPLFLQMAAWIITEKPDLIFTQFQGTEQLTPDQLRMLRQKRGVHWVNWNGDYSPKSLVNPDMLNLLREVDVQLVVNASVLDTYKEQGVKAAFWPHAYETAVRPLPDVPAYDVVYLGNCYSEFRKTLYPILRSLPCSVGIYGNGWPQAEGECTYDFTMGEALYRRAKITISDNEYTDAPGYLSNRPFQAMYAGCFLLQQFVPALTEWTGLAPGFHYGGFEQIAQLPMVVERWLNDPDVRNKVANQGQQFVSLYHSFESRVLQLMEEIVHI